MGYRSKTYSLSDDVVEAIEREKAGGTSPNQLFRRLLGLEKKPSVEASSTEAAPTPEPVPVQNFEGRRFYRRDR